MRDSVAGRGRESVVLERDAEADAPLGLAENIYRTSYRYRPVKSVAHAVDSLVAEGILPARFSTAYRAGWAAALAYHRMAYASKAALAAAEASLPAWQVTR